MALAHGTGWQPSPAWWGLHDTVRSLRMLHPAETLEKWALVIRDYTAHMDASGTSGQRVTCFAGFIAPARKWALLTKAWRSILKSFGLPYFHMTELASQRGGALFRGWDNDRKSRLVELLAGQIRKTVTVAFAGSIVQDNFDAILSPAAKAFIGDPYVACFQMAIQVVLARWAVEHVPKNEQLGMIIDQDDCGRMLKAAERYYSLKALWDQADRLGAIQFADKTKVVPLQTPDMLAHQVFQHLRDGLPEQGKIRNILLWMLSGVPHQHVAQFDRDKLAAFEAMLRRDGVI